ncbi:MAG: hypothetical protein WCT26_03550 [Candidatus Buchananbacteria bacterium]|jgi:hypothetical protein
MRKTTKISKKTVHSINKKASSNKMQDDVAVPIIKSEPAYININEHSAEIAAKSRTLWTIVAIFSIILAIFWIIMLRININKQTSDIGFNQIGQQITDSLARFDTEIKDRSASKPITAEDMAAIKNGLEDSIKSNPDSSLWPTHEFPSLKISLQYPNDWNFSSVIDGIMIRNIASSTNPDNNYGKIFVGKENNTGKQTLSAWAEKNKPMFEGYREDKSIFINNSFSDTLKLINNSSSTNSSSEIVLINSTTTKAVYIFQLSAKGDLNYYHPLMEEIIRTIKMIK